MPHRDSNELGPALRDASILAMSRVQGATALAAEWTQSDGSNLREQAARLLDDHADAARILGRDAERLSAGISLTPFLEANSPFGPSWSGHPFASPAMNVGYKLREPDLTRELAILMGPSAGRLGSERAVSFLRVLTKLIGASSIHETLVNGVRPNIAAEHRIKTIPRQSGRLKTTPSAVAGHRTVPRIDLLFDWPVGEAGQRAVVVIEAKLGASVSDGQLDPYRKEAARLAKGGPVALGACLSSR